MVALPCALVLLATIGSSLATSYVTSGWSRCTPLLTAEKSAKASFVAGGGMLYTLDRSAAQDAATAWNSTGARFTFIWVPDGEGSVMLYSDTVGRTGTLAWATNYGLLGCITSSEVVFNKFYGFNPPNDFCDTTFNPPDSWYDLVGVAEHELGHSLGLSHSNDPTAIMWQSIPGCQFKRINGDDIAGIQAIYGAR